jgi:hypothetical protein
MVLGKTEKTYHPCDLSGTMTFLVTVTFHVRKLLFVSKTLPVGTHQLEKEEWCQEENSLLKTFEF